MWKSIAKWKTTLDRFSSASKKRKILITSSAFLAKYALHHPLHAGSAQKQFDLIDHFIDTNDPSTLERQIEEGTRWDSDINQPWIMWNAGTLGKSRLADHHTIAGCVHTSGILMFVFSLPGSSSILYGDEVGLQSTVNASDAISASTPTMQWADASNETHTCAHLTIDTVKNLTSTRRQAVPLYMNTVVKYNGDEIESRNHNYLIQVLGNSTVILERYYPRRNRYLLIVNFGTTPAHHDLSSIYYGGQTLVSSSGTKHGYIKLSNLSLLPGEGLLLLLDK